jgi:iron-sulfur cluster repair protein YtfE (RIC family)
MSLRGRLKQASRAIKDAVASGQDDDEATDILVTLKHEHDEVKQLLSDLQDADTAGQRRRLVKQIKAALLPHTKAEEKVVYDAVIRLRDKEAQTDGHEGYLEHEWASKTLQRLESITNATSPEHRAAAKVLKELVDHHIQEEESQVWADVKEHFSDDQRARMNTAFLHAKARVRVAS